MALLLACAAPWTAWADAEQRIDRAHRKGIILFLSAEDPTAGRALLDRIEATIRRSTGLEPRLLPAPIARACKDALGCVVGALSAEPEPPRYLLAVSHRPGLAPDEVVVAAALVDFAIGLSVFRSSSHQDPNSEELDAAIHALAMPVKPDPKSVKSPSGIGAYVDSLVGETLRPSFVLGGILVGLGELVLELPSAGIAIAIDGERIGSSTGDRVVIEGLPAGAHRVALAHADYRPFEVEVEVEEGGSSQRRPDLARQAVAPALRASLFWGGLGLAVLGSATVIYAAAKASSADGLSRVCLQYPGRDCGSSEFLAFGSDPKAQNPGSGTVLIAPLGLGAIAAGGVFAAGGELWSEEQVPWLPWLGGLGAGVLTYGLSAALNGHGPR
jgi:hypothetical protein